MTNPNGQTPAQPTGKRQLHGASPVSGATYAEKRTPATQDREPEDRTGGGVAAFPGEVASEMKKVIWPTGRQMLNYTLIVFAFLIVITALVWGTDILASKLIQWILIR
ncbi:preprotein translocase subunit SecE [Corynebacterium aquatimens]|uniref:preprotein translocase subunit SecE n=1 Tax=Corynebacterium TaxID=1716 RepID=UPI001F3936C8|nr:MULTISPECIES: preprotein translocase subunit SecE [Corynebacterium]QYH20314.1 preprotein translocase subunit SecE [Corynebacterium aquatimens]UIZ92418.1 preprotein translocase subunit SecE [Corynebacterium sp. CNCTC7651]